jgi:hypothetical protein
LREERGDEVSGWIATALLILGFLVVAVMLTRRAAATVWDHLIVFVLAGLLIVPFYKAVTGDVSVVLPDVWSNDADGKDQIILVSVAATFLWPLSAAALVVWAVKGVLRAVKSQSGKAQ